MNRRGASPLATSPVMVGAITTLIVIVAVFLAYNANTGLPFIPSYRVSVQVPNAGALLPGNDVRIGGVRVGVVESVEPVQRANGNFHAEVGLKLDKEVEPLPKGSTVIVRTRSALGLKYLEIDRADSSRRGYSEGSTLPLAAAQPHPVEFDQFLSTFDAVTRRAIRSNLVEFGNALAGRGADLNLALGELRPALTHLGPVARNLASPRTGLERFIRALADTAAEVAPVADTQAELFVFLDTTFVALASVSRPFIQDTLSETPVTFDTLTRTSPRIRSFLGNSATLFGALRPGVTALSDNAPAIAGSLETGTGVLPDAPGFNAQLPPTARSLEAFAQAPEVNAGINGTTQLFDSLTPTLRFVTPAQSVCNYGTILLRNASSLLSIGDGVSTTQRFLVMSAGDGPNSENGPSSGPAHGGTAANFLHSNPYPNTAAPGQTRECEAGNEDYIPGRIVVGNVPGNQGTRTAGQR